ncbi:MAG: pyridoxal-phosphate dependent enzyme [Thermoplasmata archaeon]|nr:pyridoxal-phosphate dependent enzyme [Thermoplasmata archaeon]
MTGQEENSVPKVKKNGEKGKDEVPQKDAESFSLLDGATSFYPVLQIEMDDQRKVAADSTKSLEERLEAFEDIKDSEIGDTNMARARNIEHQVGLRQIYLKFDGGNPTGTQKDRIAFVQAMDALRRGYDSMTVATCGNYGAAIALAASVAGLKCIIVIPDRFHTKRIKEMEEQGAIIRRVPGNYEDSVKHSVEMAQNEDMYDANPGGINTNIQLKGYAQIAFEIYDELRDAPYAVAVPVSNGTTLAGIYKGFVSLYRRGKTSRIPKIVAGSSYGKNPIVHAFRKNLPKCEDLSPLAVKETEINEPLINWHSIDGDLALEAIRSSGGWAADATDKEMLQFAKLIREKEGMNVLPASTAGLIALLERHTKEHLPGDRYVVLLTGRKT